jgi:hypothetical protein
MRQACWQGPKAVSCWRMDFCLCCSGREGPRTIIMSVPEVPKIISDLVSALPEPGFSARAGGDIPCRDPAHGQVSTTVLVGGGGGTVGWGSADSLGVG